MSQPSQVDGQVTAGYIVPGYPQVLLTPGKNLGWQALHDAFGRVREEIESLSPDLLLLYSTQWLSVIGHQIQADPDPEWIHVDPEWHELGEIPYRFRMDAEFASTYKEACDARGLHARTVAYHGFPIDTGSVVALKLLDPDSRIPAGIVSCNMYADRAETLVLGKAATDALRQQSKRAVAIAVTALSNRRFTEPIHPREDHISSLKDDEWNRKILEILSEGRLEDVAQLARTFSQQSNGDQKMKAIWWLAAVMGQHNNYLGVVHEYQALWGTGGAVVGLTPSQQSAANLEFDEEDVEVYVGDRDVLASKEGPSKAGVPQETALPPGIGRERAVRETILADSAPSPVGAYPHAKRVGDQLYLSGVGPRQPGDNSIPGGPVHDAERRPLNYDIGAQTRAVIENVRSVLAASGASLQDVLDVTVFLIDMQRDFATFNKVYTEHFEGIGAARTTVEVRALPTPIAVEFKVVARVPDANENS